MLEHTSLKLLVLAGNKFSDTGIRCLAGALGQSSTLVSLDLSGNDAAEEWLPTLLAALASNSILTSLDVSECVLDEAGTRALALLLQKNSPLLCIQLGSCSLGDNAGGDWTVKAIQMFSSCGCLLSELAFFDRLSASLSVCPSACHLSVCLSICLFITLSFFFSLSHLTTLFRWVFAFSLLLVEVVVQSSGPISSLKPVCSVSTGAGDGKEHYAHRASFVEQPGAYVACVALSTRFNGV